MEEDRKERLKKFDSFYEGISSREKVSYSTAANLIDDGKQVRCGKHIMKVKDNLLLIGQILEDETIQWVHPSFVAPLFFELQWLVYDYKEEERLKEEFMAELSYEINGPRGKPVTFEDQSLETIIRRELNIYKDDLTEINLLKLSSISPNYKDAPISCLKGVKYAQNLRSISIKDNPEFDTRELRELTSGVVSLSLQGCAINNISILKELNLPMLACIFLNHNQIKDLSILSRFERLSHIDVLSNSVKDIRPLNEIPYLDCINLRENPVDNIQELQLPEVRYLYLDGIHTEDWSFLLTNFPRLEYVSVSLEGMTAEEKRSIKNVKKQKKFEVVW
ncbi:leucine-rich repeat domain-containing protein [Paenibacillus sp. CMAA1364]